MAAGARRLAVLRGALGLAAALSALLAPVSEAWGQGAGVRRLLRESFADNQGGWVEADDDAVRLAVEGGVYTVELKQTSGYYLSSPPVAVPTAGDLDLEAIAERRGGAKDHGFGLVWHGSLQTPHSFHFLILFADGTYSLGSQREGLISYVARREPAAPVPRGNERTFVAVRRRGPVTHCYVNGAKLATALSGTPFGDRVGLYVTRPGVVAVDSFEVSASASAHVAGLPPGPGPCGHEAGPEPADDGPGAACRTIVDHLDSAAVVPQARLGEAARLGLGAAARWPDEVAVHVAAARAALEAQYLGGNRYDRQGVRAQALPLAERALTLAPDLPEALNAHAEVLLGLEEPGRANRSLARSLELAPGYGPTYLTLGRYFDRTGQPGAAREAWGRGLALAPRAEDQAAVLLGMGRQLLRDGDREGALQALAGSLALRPGAPGVLADEGALLSEAGRHEEAVAAYEAALALGPGSFEARWGLGRAWQAKAAGATGREAARHRAAAVAEYRQALLLAPEAGRAREVRRAIDELTRLGID